jgi:hypothetical protein
VLIDKQVDPLDKTSYIRFFLWVYLNTEGGSDAVVPLPRDDTKDGQGLFNAIQLLAQNNLMPMANTKVIHLPSNTHHNRDHHHYHLLTTSSPSSSSSSSISVNIYTTAANAISLAYHRGIRAQRKRTRSFSMRSFRL